MRRTPTIPEAVERAIRVVEQASDRERLSYDARMVVSATVRRRVVPRRKPGRKNSRLDAAWIDYRAGIRGLQLFRKYIPGHDRMSRWRRSFRQKRLMNTLHKRASRERARRRTRRERRSRQPAQRSSPGRRAGGAPGKVDTRGSRLQKIKA